MKRTLLTLMCLMLTAALALATVNRTLIAAQDMYTKAKTVAEYTDAKNMFQSAYNDVGYVAAEHDKQIKKGIKDCEAKIKQLSPRPNANSSSQPANATPAAQSQQEPTPPEPQEAAPEPSEQAPPVAEGVEYKSIEFRSTDGRGNIVTNFGNSLYKEEALLVEPRVYYTSPKAQRGQVCVKAYRLDGTLWTLPDGPEGYTLCRNVNFEPGSNSFTLKGIGEATPQFEPGEYPYELWVNGECVLKSKFTIESKQAKTLQIKNVTFTFGTYNGHRTVTPRISYYSPASQKKDIYYKYYGPDGLLKDSSSPKGFTSHREFTFKQGNASDNGATRVNASQGAFSPGTYTLEIWIDGKQMWTGTFEPN